MPFVPRTRRCPTLPALGAVVLLGLAAVGCRGPADAKDEVDLDRDLAFAMKSARAGLWNEAMYRWERALDLRPDDARLRNNLGVAYEHEGRYEDAQAQYEKALALAPGDEHIKRNFEAFQSFRAGAKDGKGEAPDAERPAVETSHAGMDHGS